MTIRTSDEKVMNVISYIIVGLFALIAVVPFFIVLINSFASEHSIIYNGYSFWPKEFSLDAYHMVFQSPEKMFRAYGVTIFVTGFGTAVSLFLSMMAAYVMYRKDVRYRNALSFFLYFTTLFNGGLVPYYLLIVQNLHLKNTIFVLLLAGMFNVFNILILRNFLNGSLPDALVESAKIDGAGDFRIFWQIVIPLSKPAMAAIGMFTALGYWNDWWTPMMFIEKESLYPLQYTLYQILSSANFSSQMVNSIPRLDMPKESLKLALTMVATGPIVLLYPFVQKYFVQGITVGAVKG
ncbi:Melibiose/raffinose/stachyose import permease protein MelC [Paenibacillus auburnensis]|jgi:putative aldouronate transport system permease protein|uniref:Melibiose/raffinose/stachyose import permease protein MelC n=1 Tax=Paenibacillus auburnensis TaxID=2905649 RepID=A0ABN8H2L5_9BACL|nr:carbohydrate ABC transporter permease [Paenibacillus auburnensis]CAH1221743.1 Melibiose/raffinose/stachyose import permease protein MelC [Paenibacillus auburnensis]